MTTIHMTKHRRGRRTQADIFADVLALAGIERTAWKAGMDALAESGVPVNLGGSPMVPENWPKLLEPGLRHIFSLGIQEGDPTFKREQIFPLDTSERAKEKYLGIGELGHQGFNQFEKTGRVTYDGAMPGWYQEMEHREYAEGVQIARKLMDDNLYPGAGIPKEITQRISALARAAKWHREYSAAALFNNAFTDTGTDNEGHAIAGPDGVGLISTAHKNSPSDSSTQSNEFTLALTGANLTTVKLAMQAYKDDRGHLSPAHPTDLLVPPALEETARIINGSDLDPTSANNAINPNKGRWNIIVWDHLTDPTAWFLIDPVRKREFLVWLDRIMPEFAAEADFDTLIAKYRAYYRFSRGWSDWRWIAGSKP